MNMQTPREYWPRWAELLHHHKLDQFAAWFLDAGAPFALLGAQVLYFSRGFIAADHLDALARTLEDDAEARAFAHYLQARGPEAAS
jgi:hypothetical protein